VGGSVAAAAGHAVDRLLLPTTARLATNAELAVFEVCFLIVI